MFFCIPKPNLQPGVSLMRCWDWRRLESHRQKKRSQKSSKLNKFQSDCWLYLSNKIWMINCCHILKRSPQQCLNYHFLLKSAVWLAWSQNHEHVCGVVLPPTGKKTIFIFQGLSVYFWGEKRGKTKKVKQKEKQCPVQSQNGGFLFNNYSLEITRQPLCYGFQTLIVTVEENAITCWRRGHGRGRCASHACPSGSGRGAASWRNLALGWVTQTPTIGSFQSCATWSHGSF